MRNSLTIERVANTIRMQRSTFQGSFLLVEGDSDKKFYNRFIDKFSCRLEICKGKPSSKKRVINILEILNGSNFQGVLGIVDADFDHIEGTKYNNPNLVLTDTHDLETMLIQSPALDKIITEFGSEDKIKEFNQDIRETLVKLGIKIGYLRWISQSEGLNLAFNKIEFRRFLDEKTLQINQIKLIQEIKNKSQDFSIPDTDLQKKLEDEEKENHDSWHICCGHDLVKILSIALCKKIGSNNTNEVKVEILERSLRLAYEETYFYKTLIYSNICKWEINNKPFKIF